MYISKTLCFFTIIIFQFILYFNVNTLNEEVLKTPDDFSTIHGYIDVYIGESFGNNDDQTIIVLKNSVDESLYQLHFKSRFPGITQLTSGMNVQVKGFVSNKPSDILSHNYRSFDVESMDIISNSNSLELSDRISKSLFSEPITRKLAVVLINFKDQKLDCSREYIENLIWGDNQSNDYGSVKKAVEVNSFGKVLFSKHSLINNDVFGPFTINAEIKKADKCEPNLWAKEALAIARSSGLSLKDYDHIMYILPNGKQKELCGWFGLAQLGCPYKCSSWISLCSQIGVYIHELGHNLGFQHSSFYDFSTNEFIEYGDPVGIMGNAFYRGNPGDIFYFNVIHKLNAGWIDESNILNVNTTGIYKVSPFNIQPLNGKPQVIRIVPPYKLSVNSRFVASEFTLSFLSGENVVMNATCFVHMSVGPRYPSYNLEKLTLDGVVSWRDPNNIFSVRLLDINSKEMTVNIIFNCIYSAPVIKLKEGSSYILPPPNVNVFSENGHMITDLSDVDIIQHAYIKDATIDHTITFEITNTDSEVCPSSIFKYYIDKDGDMGLKCDKPDLYLYPQQTCTFSCTMSNLSLNNAKTSLNFSFVDINYVYSPNLHKIEFNLNLLNETNCWKAGIDFLNEIDLLEAIVNGKMTYNILSIKNYDSSSCPERNLLVNIYFMKDDSNEIKVITNDLKIILQPQQSNSLFLDTTAPDSPGDWKLMINISESEKLLKHSEIPVIVMDKCIRGKIRVNYERDVELYARSGGRLVFTVENTDRISCPSENLHITASALTHSLDINVHPKTIHNLKPKERSEFYVTTTTSDYILSTLTSKIIVKISGDNVEEEYIVDVTITPTLCERNVPTLFLTCLEEVIGIYEERSNYHTSIQCLVYWKNMNTFPCKGSTYSLDLDISFNNDIEDVDVSYKLDSIFEALPQNSSSHSLDLQINSNDLLPYIDSEYVTMTMNMTLTDLTYPSIKTSNRLNIFIGLCIIKDPILNIDNSTINMFSGSKRTLKLTIENVNSIFCNHYLYTIEVENPNQDIIIKVDPNANVLSNSIEEITFTVTASKESQGKYNLKLIVRDTNYPEYYSSINLEIDIDNSCIVDIPLIQSETALYKLEIGESKLLSYLLTFKNNDSKDCPVSSYNATMFDKDLPVRALSLNSYFDIYPQDEVHRNFYIDVPDFLIPGNYSVVLMITDGEELTHSLNYTLNFEIACPIPKPVQYIEAIEKVYFIGAKVNVELSWKSCLTPRDCCCPCKWEIYNHDKLIGITDERKFTFTPTILRTGTSHNFSIHVIDKFGRKSSINTCGYTKYKFVSLKPFEYILITLFVLIMISIPATVIYKMIRTLSKNKNWEEYTVKVY